MKKKYVIEDIRSRYPIHTTLTTLLLISHFKIGGVILGFILTLLALAWYGTYLSRRNQIIIDLNEESPEKNEDNSKTVFQKRLEKLIENRKNV
jgi:hypothetical protein